jgi:hypothetical protein
VAEETGLPAARDKAVDEEGWGMTAMLSRPADEKLTAMAGSAGNGVSACSSWPQDSVSLGCQHPDRG